MSDVTLIFKAIESGDPQAASELLPLVYQELRRIAAARLGHEKPGQTIQATALVHEAYLRLVGQDEPKWQSRGHFFAAAAEAMRRILVDNARRKLAVRHGGGLHRVELDDALAAIAPPCDDFLALDEALSKLVEEDKTKADVVKLRFFAGLSIDETAAALDISRATAVRHWTYARAWLHLEITGARKEN
jgi:RNA polymerase sigma factor (TIGR02999 family)